MAVPSGAAQAVLVKSEPLGDEVREEVRGHDFGKDVGGVNYDALFDSLKYTGFQATNFGKAVDIINRMLEWRLSELPFREEEADEFMDIEVRKKVKCTIFLGYTSCLISAGVRESIRFLVQNKMVNVLVSSAGGIEEDFIKCIAPTFIGDFALPGAELRTKGLNRIGNLLVPNDNYCKFETWITPILDAMLEEQQKDGVVWTPSKMIARMGKEINDERSVYYWAYKNNIPVFSPALTDGSIGDMLYFHSYLKPGLVLDIVSDIRGINDIAMNAKQTGMIILGGGLIKHHICNANLMRNGADFSVFVNTAQEFDGSDSGARPDEAISWGKIKVNAPNTKIYADASMVFPLLVAQTFAKEFHKERSSQAL